MTIGSLTNVKQLLFIIQAMKRMLAILSVLLLTMLCGQINAQKSDKDNNYNLQRAWEVLREDNDTKLAFRLVNQQLQDTPDNVEALMLRARLASHNNEYRLALSDLTHALKVNKPKRSEIPMSSIHWLIGQVYYSDMGEDAKAVESFEMAYKLAQKDDRKNLQSISFDYANSLYGSGDTYGAAKIYRAMLAEDESDITAMVGLARHMIDNEQYLEAVNLLEKARMLDSDYEEIYRFLMKAYIMLDDLNKAVDAALPYFDKSEDPDQDAVLDILAKRPSYAEAAIKSLVKSSDDPLPWRFLLARLYEYRHDYADAVKEYDAMEESLGSYDQITFRRSNCYEELGLFDRAIEAMTSLLENEDYWMLYVYRGDQYRLSGRLDEAIADFSSAIEEDPMDSFAYYCRGWCYELKGDRRKAMDDYNLGIEIDEDYPYLFLMRGELLLLDGKKTEAEADFETVLQKDTIADNGSCRMYALHLLGREDEAEEWTNKIIASDPEDAGNYYDQACLYSRMGRPEESIAALKTAFEKGYCFFTHIRTDDDMDPVRDLPEFKALMEEYESRHAVFLQEFELAKQTNHGESTITEVSMKRSSGGTFEIPCDINGLSLQMVFDTGASNVTISSLEANFMLKNGYLSAKDVKGTRYYQVASGELNAGTNITLREVKIGDAVLKNVEATVVKNQKAPLLLGQSAMERFGTITIDKTNNKLIINH